MDENLSVALISALAEIWSTIQKHHPDVPPVVLLPAPAQRGRMNVLGHFAALRWRSKKEKGGNYHEVVVVAEHLNRSAESVTETLLHEAAHAMNFARGIKDCTKSQYHNLRYKVAAEEVGLVVEQVRHYGWALTSMPVETVFRYRKEILALESVLVHRHTVRIAAATKGDKDGDDEGDEGRDTKPIGRLRKATCSCSPSFIIRVSRKTIEETTILCGSCGEPFRIV